MLVEMIIIVVYTIVVSEGGAGEIYGNECFGGGGGDYFWMVVMVVDVTVELVDEVCIVEPVTVVMQLVVIVTEWKGVMEETTMLATVFRLSMVDFSFFSPFFCFLY